MSVVESLLRLITAQGADALTIAPDVAPVLEKKGERQALSMPYPGDDIVAEMVAEVTEPKDREAMSRGQVVETVHTSGEGVDFAVRLEPRGARAALSFRLGAPTSVAPARAAEPAKRPHPPAPAPPAASAPARATPRDTSLDAGLAVLCEPGPLREVFARATVEDASDILLSSGRPAHFRVGGEIVGLSTRPVDDGQLLDFVQPALTTRARDELDRTGSTDFALVVRDPSSMRRFRANLFRQHQGLALALRPIRKNAPTLEELNLPSELAELLRYRSGLVLMTGTAGSGKSTTLVALIEHLNRSAPKHVITLEDPIEYEYAPGRALIHQRQLGAHLSHFAHGLRAALRETPDVILLGEMRDRETIAAALTAAETGHLVLSTLHAGDAPMAIDRIIDVFPEHQQAQVRMQLAMVLRAVITQRLIPSTRPPVRVPALELLRVNTAVATKIREGRGHQLRSEIQKGRGEGMIPLESSLADLVRRGLAAPQVVEQHAPDPNLLRQYLR